jgi:hypothetical protein
MIGTIAARELRSLFFSPLAWTVLAVVQIIVAYLFLVQVDFFLQIQPRLPQLPGAPGLTEIVVAPTFGNAALILLLVVPLLTMRLVSDELRNQTLSLLFSAPVSMTAIILGKYCGVLGFLLIQLLLIALLPCALLLGGTLDFGILASGLLGLFSAAGGFRRRRTVHVHADRAAGDRRDQHLRRAPAAVDRGLERDCRQQGERCPGLSVPAAPLRIPPQGGVQQHRCGLLPAAERALRHPQHPPAGFLPAAALSMRTPT